MLDPFLITTPGSKDSLQFKGQRISDASQWNVNYFLSPVTLLSVKIFFYSPHSQRIHKQNVFEDETYSSLIVWKAAWKYATPGV